MSRATASTFRVNEPFKSAGKVADDGQSASFFDLWLDTFGGGDGVLCRDSSTSDCRSDDLPPRNISVAGPTFLEYVEDTSTAAARPSFKPTLLPGNPAPVPVPAALPLLLTVPAALAALRRRRRG